MQRSITFQKYVGKLRKRRSLVVGVVVLFLLALMGVQAPTSRALLVDALDPAPTLIVEEVSERRPVSTLPPSLFGGAFVSESYGVGASGVGLGGQEEEPVGVLVHSSSLLTTLSPVTIEASTNSRSDITTYTVQAGDTPSTIAARFGITTNTLLWANNLVDGNIIRPGDELKILPVTGLIHTVKSGETLSGIADRFGGDAQDIIAFNGLPADGSLQAGDAIVIPDGVKPRQRYTVASRSTPSLPNVSGYFIYPAPGYRSQGLHGYNAVDIAHGGCYAYDVPVYAAAAGRATLVDGSGWNGGYGKFTKIQHANGTATLYAHLRAVTVRSGQSVSQGQIIGLMGSTGRSTGCHVHFEVYGARNPFAF